MSYEKIIYKQKEGVGIITFNSPGNRNAMSKQFMNEMCRCLDELRYDSSVKVIILTGGTKWFASGIDLKEAQKSPMTRQEGNEGRGFFRKIQDFPKPVIAAVSGACVAGGCEMLVCCDMCVASETAYFGLSEILFGALPAGGAIHRLPRIIGTFKAKELLFTGENIDVKEAYRIGLVNKVTKVESLMDEALTLARKIADLSDPAMRLCKYLVNKGLKTDLDTALDYDEFACTLENMGTPEERLDAVKKAAKRFNVYKKIFADKL